MDDNERTELIGPFYLEMMRTNAVENGLRLVPTIVQAARNLSSSDVIALLRIAWREKVMGAWFALTLDDESVTAAVLDALARSCGSLDSPPLAASAVVLAGDAALPALDEYATRDVSAGWGACGLVAAAVEHLGRECSACLPDDDDRCAFAALLAVALELRAAR